MNAIKYAVDAIKFRIPKAILEAAFMPYNAYGRIFQSTSLDDQIINRVIKARVLTDCNLVGGTMAVIPLEGLEFEKPEHSLTVVRIPKSLTQGRSINSVLNVTFVNANYTSSVYNGYMFNSNRASAAMDTAQAMLSAFDSIPIVSTAVCELIGENVILVRDGNNLSSNSFLRCILSNDDEMSSLPIRAYKHFGNLVEFAIKAYIYNTLRIEIDSAQLQGGMQIGVFKEIVESYSDAEQNYKDYLTEKWEAVAFAADDNQMNRYITLLTGSSR